jgi:DNA-binding NarL/FixJ family response regulator
MIEVLLAAPHPALLNAIEALLTLESDIQVVAKTSTKAEIVALIEQLQPTVVVLDMDGYGFTGIDVLTYLKITQPHIPVLVLEDSGLSYDAQHWQQVGSAGYISKYELADHLVSTIRAIAASAQQ